MSSNSSNRFIDGSQRSILDRSFPLAKRAFDIALASSGLMVLSPLFLSRALWQTVRRRSVLSRTARVGRFGSPFAQIEFSGFADRPILGKAPILLNILAGDLSVIGPRAAAPTDPILETGATARLSVKPGLICFWWLRQRGNIDFDDEVTYDLEYVSKASLTVDFGIALRAILALAFSEKRETAPRTIDILGIRIDNLSMAEALDWIHQKLQSQDHAAVYMTNAHCANISCLNPAYHRALLASELNLADGIGLRLAGKLKGTPIRQNVNGTDLFPRLCAMLEGTTESLYLLGGMPGVADGVAKWIQTKYPATRIAGCRDGFFPRDEEQAVTEEIRSSGASVLLVAMGVPNQELWIQRNLARTGVRVGVAVGGLFDFYSGRIPRAPTWMREVGLEWTYRLLQEPSRMWKRYLIGNWTFLARHFLYEMKLYHRHSPTTEVSPQALAPVRARPEWTEFIPSVRSFTGSRTRLQPIPNFFLGPTRRERIPIGHAFVDRCSFKEAVADITGHALSGGAPACVVMPSAHHVVLLARDPVLRQIYRQADLVVPDGFSLLLAARALGRRLPERVTSVDLFEALCASATRSGLRVFLLGGRTGSADRAASVMKDRYPGLQTETYCPPLGFESSEMEQSRIKLAVSRFRPDLLFVAFGAPKQEYWIHDHGLKLGVPVCIGVGGSFEMASGVVPRAPRWMQDLGFEWFYRLCLEPRRLWRRYLVGNVQFSWMILRQAFAGTPRLDRKST